MKKVINKSGCILIDKNSDKVALVYRENYNDYSFPKGHIEGNESLLLCAVRETEEETKRIPVIDSSYNDLETNYESSEGKIKVKYFVAYDGGSSNNKSTDTHPVVWIEKEKVSEKLTYNTDKELWNNLLKKGI